MLRWLTAGSPAPVEIFVEGNHVSAGDEVKVRARMYDQGYRPVSDTEIWLTITDPESQVQDLQMEEEITRDGDHVAAFTASKPGVYQLEVSSAGGLSRKGHASLTFLAEDALLEMRGGVMNQELMEKIAQAGGGRYYTPRTADQLVRDLQDNRQTYSQTFQLDVWNIPLVFFLLLSCFGLEWLLRRRTGLS